MSGIIRGENNIVLAGPIGLLSVSGTFIAEWLRATGLADDAFQNSDIRRLMLSEHGFDLTDCFQFNSCASWLLNRSIKEDGSFVFNLEKSVQREMIVIMMKTGFLRQSGQHYMMAVPDELDMFVLQETVADIFCSDTVDRDKYAIVTMNRTNGRQLAGQLRAQNLAIQDTQTGDGGNVVVLSSYRKDRTTEKQPA